MDNSPPTQNERVIFTQSMKISVLANGEKFVNNFCLKETIGKGAFSKVKKVILHTEDNEYVYAAKIVSKGSLSKQRGVRYDKEGNPNMINNLQKIYEEIDIWKRLVHKNIICLHEVIDDEEYDKIYMIMDIADLGQLMQFHEDEQRYCRSNKVMEYLAQQYGIKSDPKDLKPQEIETIAKRIFIQLLYALQYLHESNVVHRDLKQDGGTVKLIDFTVSRHLVEKDEILYDCEGTVYFTSPEVSFCLREGYKPKPNDIWSLGICIFSFVTEILPFDGESDIEIQIKTKDKEIEYPDWLSPELVDLLGKILSKDPNKRPEIEEIMKHPWFKEVLGTH